jgi:hypothetical protein
LIEPDQAEQSGSDNENLQREELDVETENVEAVENINNRQGDDEQAKR